MIEAIRENIRRITGTDASCISICPTCDSGASRAQLIHGGIVPNGRGGRWVKMQVLCRSCGCMRTIAGDSIYHNAFALQLQNQPRRKTWR